MNRKILLGVFALINLVLYSIFMIDLVNGVRFSDTSTSIPSETVSMLPISQLEEQLSSPKYLTKDPFFLQKSTHFSKGGDHHTSLSIRPDIVLKGILYDSTASQIIVNDIITEASSLMKTKDKYKNTQIIEILPDHVIVETRSKRFKLQVDFYEPLP